jgi:hypothetical protein
MREIHTVRREQLHVGFDFYLSRSGPQLLTLNAIGDRGNFIIFTSISIEPSDVRTE